MNVKLPIALVSAVLLAAPAARALEADAARITDAGSIDRAQNQAGIVPSPLVMFGASVLMGTLAIASREFKH